ncbi:MAG: NAD(P)-binding domain-containing protein [Gammaproteobacteria bacterium]|nr:NAD(P)-binding domain-containing protein [Gammaproteobacteria bacterium]
MLENQTVGIIGAGNIGRALIGGLIRGELLAPDQVIATRRTRSALDALENDFPGLHTSTNNIEAADRATVLLLTIKPQSRAEVLSEIRDHVDPDTLLISVLAGITTQTLEQSFDEDVPVVRAMPNTPALVDEGATALAGGESATDDHLSIARQIFEAVGSAEDHPRIPAWMP